MSNLSRKLDRKNKLSKDKWAVKAVNEGALVLATVEDKGSTLASTLDTHSTTPAMGVIRLPPGLTQELISGGYVWINGTICKDPGRPLRAGDFTAVYPNEKLETYDDEERRTLRLKRS